MSVQRGLMPSILNGGATGTKVRNDAVEAANVALKMGAGVPFWEAGAQGRRVQDRMQAAAQILSAGMGAAADGPFAQIVTSNQGGEAHTGSVALPAGDTLFILGAAQGGTVGWAKDGVPINDTTRVVGTKTACLTLHNVTSADNGTYQMYVVLPDGSRVDSQTYTVSNLTD